MTNLNLRINGPSEKVFRPDKAKIMIVTENVLLLLHGPSADLIPAHMINSHTAFRVASHIILWTVIQDNAVFCHFLPR